MTSTKAPNEQFEQESRRKDELLLIEGYNATSLEDRNINTEWEQASLEKWD